MSIKDRVDFIMGGMTEHEAEIFLLSLSDAKHARISRNAATILAGMMGISESMARVHIEKFAGQEFEETAVEYAIAIEAEVSKQLAYREGSDGN